MKTNLLKKIMALALSAAMILSMSASSFAAGLESSAPAVTEPTEQTATATVTQTGTANNDELFDQYVEGMFYDGGVQTYASSVGRDSLNATGVEIYEAIKSKILTIADGTASSTVFSDIPLNINPEDFNGAFGKAIDALLQDCPSELYWYDKTVGTASSLSYSETDCFLTIKMAVANSYRKDGNQYATDSTKIAAAKKAFDNARNIASSATGSDADKLKTFKDKICEMVSYDTKAASGGAYGDSFQLTNVFDGDTSTNVVCEGYAKAFQYLCELSDIECYTVTGNMAGGTGAGPHMWNIVRLDGKSYVVDVTNCDSGTIGAPDKLFLKGVELITGGYKVAGVTYTYDSETTSLLSSDILTPSTLNYGEKPHEHTYSTEWTYDENNHWHAATCDHKTEVSGKEAHKWDEGKVTASATESAKGTKTCTCTTCGATKTEEIPQLAHTHTFSTEWAHDETNHWHEATCDHKTEVSGKEAHKWDEGKVTTSATESAKGEKTYTCTICGATKTEEIPQLAHTHTFSTEWTYDENNHWHAATCDHKTEVSGKEAHKWDEGKVTVSATESAKGTKTYTCTTCGATKTEEIPQLAHTHKPSADWSNDDTNHWHICSGCDEKLNFAAHDWDEGKVTTQPTDTVTGIKTYTCIVCKTTKVETIPVHTHTNLTHVPAKNPTCTADGNTEYYTCTCGKWFSDADGKTVITEADTVIPAGHRTVNFIDGKEPTCTAAGNIPYYYCSDCNTCFSDENNEIEITLESTVVPAAHKLSPVPATAATCTENGNTAYYTCSDCGKWFSDAAGTAEITDKNSVILLVAHKLTAVEAKQPTCTTAGNTAHHKCSVCGKLFSDAEGKTEITEADTVISAAHNPTKIEAKLATCTEAGNTAHYKCTVCGKLFKDANGTEEIDASSVIIPMAAHKLEAVSAKDPTCTVDGNIAYQTCTVCKKHFSEDGKTEITLESTVIPAAHKLELVPAKDADCTEAGNIAYQVCKVCNKYFSEDGKTEIALNTTIIPAAGHTFSTGWASNENDHWHPATCKHISEVSEKAPHSYDEGVITTHPTETTTGVKTYTCSVCGGIKTEILPVTTHIHKLVDGWKSDLSNHWNTCSDCEEKINLAAHTFGDWTVTKPATEQQTGSRERACAVCGFKLIETIPQLAHTHDLEHIAAVKPTCAKEGKVEHYHCKKCGKNYSDLTAANELASIATPIDSNNHVGGTELRGVKRATCRANGYTGDTYCLGCDKVLSYGSVIYANPNAHNYVNGRCRYCGILQFPFMYRPVITYLNDSFHFFNGMSRMHTPNSHGLYSDGIYEWYICAECGHEYGRTKVTIPEVTIDDDDSVDLIVDDPVQCGSDELLYIAG